MQERQEGVQFWLCTSYALGTNFSELHTTQEVHWYLAWRHSSYVQPGSSIYIDIQLHLLRWHHQVYRGECAALAVYYVRTWIKYQWASHHQESTLIPSFEAFILQPEGQQHLNWYSIAYTIATSILERKEGVQLWLCTTYALGTNFTPPTKYITTKHWVIHLMTSQAAGSQLIFNFIYYSFHGTIILEKQGVQLWLSMTYTLVINFSELQTTQEVHWYLAWRHSSYYQLGSCISIDIQLHIL